MRLRRIRWILLRDPEYHVEKSEIQDGAPSLLSLIEQFDYFKLLPSNYFLVLHVLS